MRLSSIIRKGAQLPGLIFLFFLKTPIFHSQAEVSLTGFSDRLFIGYAKGSPTVHSLPQTLVNSVLFNISIYNGSLHGSF